MDGRYITSVDVITFFMFRTDNSWKFILDLPRLRARNLFVHVFFEYLRMRNFPVFSICSHCF